VQASQASEQAAEGPLPVMLPETAPEQHVPPKAKRRSLIRRWFGFRFVALASVAACLAVAVAALMRSQTDGPEGRLTGPEGHPFTLEYPGGWSALSGKELKELQGSPLAVLRRQDGTSVVTVKKGKHSYRNLRKFDSRLTVVLKARMSDFKKGTAGQTHAREHDALFYSYARTRKHTANTILVVPAPRGSYIINSVTKAGAKGAARQAAKIGLSFDLKE
jgi:hypothetical protein